MGLNCFSCAVASGEARIDSAHLPGGWSVNPYMAPRSHVGWTILQPLAHRERLADLTNGEAARLGANLRLIEARLMRAWDLLFESYGDPLERVYVCRFNEAPGAHLHFHIIPRPRSFRALLTEGDELHAWKIPYLEIPFHYRTTPMKCKQMMEACGWA